MSKRPSNKQRYNFLLDKAVYDDFSLICEELGLIRSKNIERSMKQFIEQHAELLTQLKTKSATHPSHEK